MFYLKVKTVYADALAFVDDGASTIMGPVQDCTNTGHRHLTGYFLFI